VLRKSSVLFLASFIIANFYGCAAIPGPITETQKEPKLICNASYVQALVMVEAALKTEQVKFEKAIISKDVATLKGGYADGRIVQIVISKISSSESSLVVRAGSSQAGKEDARKILATIMQYSKQRK